MGKKLIFRIGEETVPTVMGPMEYRDSPFDAVLRAGLRKWTDMWQLLADAKPDNCPNNIISFVGDRGTGKTSCLLSLVNILREEKQDPRMRQSADASHFMPLIEPLFFDANHNILDIFVGELYRDTKRLLDAWEFKTKPQREKLKRLQNCFAQVKNALIFLDKGRSEELKDEPESILSLSEGVNLAHVMSQLVEAYLDCVEKKMLVISIDDIDLNISEAYEMMEQIRKYLVVPKVIILLAARFNQLRSSIELYLTKHYHPIVEKRVSAAEIKAMADRYLDKLLPLSQRLPMPGFIDYSELELEIVERGESVTRPENCFPTVEFAVLSLIYQRCGYLFYNYDDGSSRIIPRNLRELKHFVTMLYELGDRFDSKDVHTWNKEMFKEYFLTQWMEVLQPDEREIALKIWEERDPKRINALVIEELKQHYTRLWKISDSFVDENDFTPPEQVRLVEILEDNNLPANISIGDVAEVLRFLKGAQKDDAARSLLFFITAFYSMRLYELYDEMTEAVEKGDFPAGSRRPPGGKDVPKLKSGEDRRAAHYFELAGHGFFSIIGDTILPLSPLSKSRELVRIDGPLVMELIKGVADSYDADPESINKQEFIMRLNLAEFFALTVAHALEGFSSDYSPVDVHFWRTWGGGGYPSYFDSSDRNLLFDITAPFLTMIYPRQAYDRFSSRLYEIAEKTPLSLLNRVLKTGRRYKDDNMTADLMSRMAIRNMEVLESLNLWLTERKRELPDDDHEREIEILIRYFEGFDPKHGGYAVKTYLRDERADSFHTITFAPLTLLAEPLRNLLPGKKLLKNANQERKRLMELFVNIFRQESRLHAKDDYTVREVLSILRNSAEENVLDKETIISKMVEEKGLFSLSGEQLVDYLSSFEVYSKALFSTFLDSQLAEIYRKKVIPDIDSRFETAQKHWQEAKMRREGEEGHLDFLNQRYKEQVARMKDSDQKIAEWRKNIKEVEESHNRGEESCRNVRATLDSVNNLLKQAIDHINKLKEEKRKLESQASMVDMMLRMEKLTARPESKENEEKTKELENSYKNLKDRIDRLDMDIKSLETQRKEQLAIRDSQLAECRRLEEMIRDQAQQKNELKINIDSYEKASSIYREDMEKLKSQITDISELIVGLKREERHLKREFEEISDLRARVKIVLK